MNNPYPTTNRRQRGLTLIDALIAFLVLALGTLAVVRLQAQLRLGADDARQRSEAVRLAQREIEAARAFSVIDARPGARAWADIASGTRVHTADAARGGNADYTVSREVAALPGATGRSLSVSVDWADRAGRPRQVRLDTIVARADPALSAALAIAPAPAHAVSPHARSSNIPLSAKDLGDGRSAFKPVSDGATVLVQDKRSGIITSRCTLANAAAQTRDLQSTDLTSCDATIGLLLSGSVRFGATPLPLTITLALTGSGYPASPVCSSEVRKTVAWSDATGRHVDAVAEAATPASVGATAWDELGSRFTAYHCVVYPAAASGAWSGRSLVVPTGWAIGIGPGEYRVCRHSADLDGNGTIDRNIEHPAAYAQVNTALPHQNFVVVPGSDNCPTGQAVDVRGRSTDVFVDLGTAPHQP